MPTYIYLFIDSICTLLLSQKCSYSGLRTIKTRQSLPSGLQSGKRRHARQKREGGEIKIKTQAPVSKQLAQFRGHRRCLMELGLQQSG